jgi:hypothetical protein
MDLLPSTPKKTKIRKGHIDLFLTEMFWVMTRCGLLLLLLLLKDGISEGVPGSVTILWCNVGPS